MTRSSRFWDRSADRYARKPVADEAAYRQKLQMTRECFRPDMSVLEFGCGTGTTAIAHAPHVGRIQAIDSSRRMIEIARQRAEAADVSNVAFAVGSIEALPTPDRSFDAVLGLSILHLVEDPDAVVAKVHRLLRPGGVFVSSTMCLGDTMKWIKYIDPLGRALGLMPKVAVFTRAALEATLVDAGFVLERQWQPAKGAAVFIVARKPGKT